MDDLAAFLANSGLAEYYSAMRDFGVDTLGDLHLLTDDDFVSELHMKPLHRRKLDTALVAHRAVPRTELFDFDVGAQWVRMEAERVQEEQKRRERVAQSERLEAERLERVQKVALEKKRADEATEEARRVTASRMARAAEEQLVRAQTWAARKREADEREQRVAEDRNNKSKQTESLVVDDKNHVERDSRLARDLEEARLTAQLKKEAWLNDEDAQRRKHEADERRRQHEEAVQRKKAEKAEKDKRKALERAKKVEIEPPRSASFTMGRSRAVSKAVDDDAALPTRVPSPGSVPANTCKEWLMTGACSKVRKGDCKSSHSKRFRGVGRLVAK